jgi:hypothetical protein
MGMTDGTEIEERIVNRDEGDARVTFGDILCSLSRDFKRRNQRLQHPYGMYMSINIQLYSLPCCKIVADAWACTYT